MIGCGGHFIRTGSEARRRGKCVTIQAVGRRVEAKAGIALRGGVGEIAELRGRERQGAESFGFIRRWTSGWGEWLWGVTVTVEGVCRPATGVVRWAERANLERR